MDDVGVTDSVERAEGRRTQETGRRRGRRPGGADTRTALLDAAREVFTEQGYESATVRAIARRAGVDPAMVNHWFGSKEGLFAKAVLQVPFDPQQLLAELLAGDIGDLGPRIVRKFVTTWDRTGGGQFAALVRSVAGHELATNALRELFLRHIFHTLVDKTGADHSELRATLVASQLIGLGMIRYVVRFEPLASADVEAVVAAVGPTLQRYLTGELPSA